MLKKLLCAALICPLLLLQAHSAAQTESAEVPVILYHKLSRSPRPGTYTVSPFCFALDLQYLSERGYTTVTLARVAQYAAGKGDLPPKCVVIMFDDGDQSIDRYAAPLLRKYSMCAEVAVIGSIADEYSAEGRTDIRYPNLTWNQLRKLCDEGVISVQSHGYDLHKIVRGRKGALRRRGEDSVDYTERIYNDLSLMQDACLSNLGRIPVALAYPFGANDSQSEEVLDTMGFKISMTSLGGVNTVRKGHPQDLRRMRRNDRPLNKGQYAFFSKLGIK